MSSANRVTVVMPTYNAASWCQQAIDSVLAQTLPTWRLIVVDDGSTDETPSVVAGYDDPRITLIEQSNQGCYHARNVGLARASSQYIALLDADDWYEPDHLERATAFLDSHPTCSLVGTNFYFVDYKGRKGLGCKPTEIRGEPGDGVIADFFRAARRNRCFPITNCAVFRRELIREYGAFDEELFIGGDHEFWFRWAMQSSFGYVDHPTCYYRTGTPGSVRKDLGKSIRMRAKVWRKLVSLETTDMALKGSYASCRSFYLFRLTALAIAAGQYQVVREISEFWPFSPTHAYWWMGKTLSSLPSVVQRGLHAVLGRMDFVKYRQGRPITDVPEVKSPTRSA
jgi:glycosyltransferase involved in cell wall biosynthesis